MAALKRAYADIILNTQKESAARVLAAERRARGFQQTLFAVKKEAVATMLRLKALMEDKIKEAETKAVCQAKKIEELELQLGEAEDTIVDLREDLKRVREELIMMKNGPVQPLSEGCINDTFMVCNNIGKETSTNILNEPGNMSIISNHMVTLSQKTADTHQCCLQNSEKVGFPKEFSAEVDFPGNTDLAYIIWRNKVPEPYRNGYTQRIHALEHNLTSKGPFGENNGLQAFSKSSLLSCASENLQIPCKTDSSMSDKRTTQVKNVSNFKETEQQPGYCKTISSSGSSKFTVSDKWNKTEAPKETPDPFIQMSTEIGETSEDKKSLTDISTDTETLMLNQRRLDTSIETERMGIKQCTERMTWRSFQEQNQTVCEDKPLQNSLQNCEDVKDPLLSRTISKSDGHPSSVSIQEDSEARIEVAVASKAETENSDNSNTAKPDTKDIANGTAKTGTDKFLKYTFQRKRKKGSSPMKNEIVFPEKKPTLKPKSVDKQNFVPVPSKSSVAADVPRNNRRLVQVARQLISLSEKRW